MKKESFGLNKSSGLTAVKWFEEKDIPVHTLRYQIYKLNKEAKQDAKEIKLHLLFMKSQLLIKKYSNHSYYLNYLFEKLPNIDPEDMNDLD